MSVDTNDNKVEQQIIESAPGRSWPLDILGAVSVLGFFIGIAWAFQVQVGAVISAEQFERIEIGQSLEEVETIFRHEGRKAAAENEATADVEYVWENSTDSKATCVFKDGKLIEKTAKNLP